VNPRGVFETSQIRSVRVRGLSATTGAITGVVDRLEQAGLVRRERDADDRRKVFVAAVPENIAKIGRFYQHLQRAMLKVWDSYSDAELRLLLGFATQGYETMLVATEELKAMMKAPEGKRAGARKPAQEP
jgi:DNA-binding MarR family transcriptional regulator